MRSLPLTLSHCLTTLAAALAPRRPLTVSAWADEHRILSGKQAGERGRWRTARNPILREIMDALSASSRVTDIWVMKSSQVGVTEATVNFLGYTFDHAPAPVMVLMPTLDSRDAWKAQKLNPMLQETPAIRDLLGGQRSRDAANSKDMIDFPGGGVNFSSTALRMMCEGRLNSQAHKALGDEDKARKVMRVVDEYACSQDAVWAKIAREEGLCKPDTAPPATSTNSAFNSAG